MEDEPRSPLIVLHLVKGLCAAAPGPNAISGFCTAFKFEDQGINFHIFRAKKPQFISGTQFVISLSSKVLDTEEVIAPANHFGIVSLIVLWPNIIMFKMSGD